MEKKDGTVPKTIRRSAKGRKGRTRRTRSAAGDRNFVCGCGKAYLSYPALYTHVKNKHEGTFPEGSELKKMLKRPEDEIEDYSVAEKLSYKNEVRGFLRRLEGAYDESGGVERNKILKQMPKDFFEDNNDFRPLQRELSKIFVTGFRDNQLPSVDDYKQSSEALTCDKILSYFIIDFSSYITPNFCKEFLIFVFLIRKAYNEHGYSLKRGTQQLAELVDKPLKAGYCLTDDISLLPELANKFIAELFPAYFASLNNTDELCYIGIKDNLIINILFLVKFLCNWLLIHDFTVLKLEINTDS
jgi:hypothetical protein